MSDNDFLSFVFNIFYLQSIICALWAIRDIVKIKSMIVKPKFEESLRQSLLKDSAFIMKAWGAGAIFWLILAAIFIVCDIEPRLINQFLQLGFLAAGMSLLANYAHAKHAKQNIFPH